MKNWKIIGIIATIVIVLSFPLYLVKSIYLDEEARPDPATAAFVGGETCIECHKPEYDLWVGSDHDNAMDTAVAETVLGDFNDAEFEYKGFINRFYIKDGKYFVHTQGPEGKAGDYQIAYTFGVRPLQQYLIPFEDGRYQCLPITWDTEKKEWYHLYDTVYSGQDIKPGDWLYWTNNAQNWNGMCAECHSTNLHKGYDPETHVYNTTWSEIDVSCEACHGPSSAHLDWAKLPEMARPSDDNFGLVVRTSNITSQDYVDKCAYCHVRRSSLGDYGHTGAALLDHLIPQLPNEPYYFADGQILEEDYVYGSFTQSKMYMNDIQCNDCHNVHSLELVLDGNELCLQCHIKGDYDTYYHHFHKYAGEPGDPIILDKGKKIVEVGEGALCVNCHMPGRYYMGVDFRLDHSIRIPRPGLSIELGTPNACTQCHTDETDEWAYEYTREWYGIKRRPHYGTLMAAGHNNDPDAIDGLANLALDELISPLVRAGALELLSTYQEDISRQTLDLSLTDPLPVVRHIAVRHYFDNTADEYVKKLSPLLHDPIKAVRMEAAVRLAALPEDQLDTLYKEAYEKSLQEYISAMNYTADFAASRHNLGNLYASQGKAELAEKSYKEALRIDDQFFPAMFNLAMVYNQMGQNDKAEMVYRHLLKNHPELHEAYYSLGLLLAEQDKFDESVTWLQKAAEYMPDNARIYYNLGLLLQYLNRIPEAENALLKTLDLEPDNLDFLYAVIDFYIKTANIQKAKDYAGQILEKYPGIPEKEELLNFINSER